MTEGVKVYGFGEQKTPEPFVNACSKFTYLETLLPTASAEPVPSPPPRTAQELRGDTRLMQMLRNAIESARDDDGWSHLGLVGHQIGNQASFDSRNYGYRKLSDLIEATGQFEVRRDEQIVWVRYRPRRRAATKASE